MDTKVKIIRASSVLNTYELLKKKIIESLIQIISDTLPTRCTTTRVRVGWDPVLIPR